MNESHVNIKSFIIPTKISLNFHQKLKISQQIKIY